MSDTEVNPMDDAENCPFCDGSPRLTGGRVDVFLWRARVKCDNCDMSGPSVSHRGTSPEAHRRADFKAVALWNTRALPYDERMGF